MNSPSLKLESHLKLEVLMCDSDLPMHDGGVHCGRVCVAVIVCTAVVCVHGPKAGW